MLNIRKKTIDNARIDLRTRAQQKSYFELAAFFGGYDSLSNFMIRASEKLAESVFHEAESRSLSDEDRDLLVKFLQNSPDPIPVLSEAYKKITKLSRMNHSL
jgi:uncharacterized protein (DUF1778 family)